MPGVRHVVAAIDHEARAVTWAMVGGEGSLRKTAVRILLDEYAHTKERARYYQAESGHNSEIARFWRNRRDCLKDVLEELRDRRIGNVKRIPKTL